MKYILIILACLPSMGLAQSPRPDMTAAAIASLETGVICAPETTGERDAPGTYAGTTHIIAEEPPFVSHSRRVPAVLGMGFGVKAQSLDPDGLTDVKVKITHPAMGTTGLTSQVFSSVIPGTRPALTFYQFDHDYELLHGIWQLEASHDGEIVYRQTFEVLPPERVPELAKVCGYTDLFS